MSEKYKYEMVIYWSAEDQAFIVEVPELAGCMADGKTYAEAVGNAEIIIEEWIETAKELGREIPRAKRSTDICRAPAYVLPSAIHPANSGTSTIKA